MATTRMPAFGGGPAPLNSDEYLIKGAYLMQTGGFTVSTLYRTTNEKNAADVSREQVVWSEWAGVADLLKGAIMLQCGDTGYKYGDINRDCKVDFRDFAIFAQGWLDCTTPGDPNCGPGEVFP